MIEDCQLCKLSDICKYIYAECCPYMKTEEQLCLGQQQIKVAVNIFLQKNLVEMKVIHYGFVLSYIYMGRGTQIPIAVTFPKEL